MKQSSATRFTDLLSLRAIALTGIFCFCLSGCRGATATARDCGEILDRIVQLELEEKGFRDPVLRDRKRREVRQLLASELKECEGKRLSPGALACIRQATNTEKISHECL